ncbi:MAG: nitroreductase family protein [Syntrophomonadaceae bacterium]|nr:nitroreductase family protein [Syntrophomonadaceae bacterium]
MINTILSRRSIRQFKPAALPSEIVESLLKAAMAAPSAHNEQPWQFVVINEREILDQVPSFHPNSAAIKQAPIAIAVCADMTLLKREGAWPHDCSAATMNILLAAHGQGLGAVWFGIYPDKERMDGLSKLLNLPEHVIPFSLIPLGYPAESKPPANRYKPERIHFNRW